MIDMRHVRDAVPVFWYGVAASFFLVTPLFLLLLKLNSRQKVSEYAPESHQAKQGTPTMGGLMFVVPFLLLAVLPGLLGYPIYPNPSAMAPLSVLFFLFAVIGFVDDYIVPRVMPGKRGLGWKQKLVAQFIAAAVFAYWTEGFLDSGGTRGLSQVGLDVFLILFCANAYNFADGLDGLASSIALLLFPGLVVINFFVGRSEVIFPLFLLAGTMFPFIFLNAPKAKVFMGDVGSLPVGAMIGAMIAIPLNNDFMVQHGDAPIRTSDPTIILASFLLMLLLIAELVPVPLQIIWVKVFKKRLFPFTPIHHAFEKAGWPETRVVALFALVQLLCTLAVLTLLLPITFRTGARY